MRKRLNEKFNRGAENQAFLVESITGGDAEINGGGTTDAAPLGDSWRAMSVPVSAPPISVISPARPPVLSIR